MNGHFPPCRCTRCCNKCCNCIDKNACNRRRALYPIFAVVLIFTIIFAATKYYSLISVDAKKNAHQEIKVLPQNQSVPPRSEATAITKTSSKKYKIAILEPLSHPALDEIQNGFMETIKKIYPNAHFDFYDGNNDRMLMRSQIEKVYSEQYDLICAVTTASALLCKEISQQRKSFIPTICCAADDQILTPLLTEKDTFIIVNDKDNFELQIASLLFLKKTNHIILPYSPSPSLEAQIVRLKKICEKNNIILTTVSIFAYNELMSYVDSLIKHNDDVILVLKDNMMVSAIESLVALAQRKNITLYASDLNSVDKGAAIGFGVSEYSIGEAGAHAALSLLNNEPIESIKKIQYSDKFIFKINSKETKKQNINITPQISFLLTSTQIIN